MAYVAATRAKKRLFVSGAYWYGLPEPRTTPAKPSELFEMVENHAGSVSAGHAASGPRPALLRAPDATPDPDPLFTDGWQSGIHMAREDPARIDRLAAERGVEDEYERLVSDWNERLFDLEDLAPVQEPDERTSVSVTSLVTYAQCPKRFYWTDVDPLPRRHNEAAARGSEIHRRIELDQRGQVPLQDLEPDLYDALDAAEKDGTGGYPAYEGSRYADERARFVEAPFSLELDNGVAIRGRIDAIYDSDGHWEVVDFKSGRRKDDPSRVVQLEAYAVAVNDVGFAASSPDSVDVTFAYLGGGLEVVTERADESWVSSARDHLRSLTDAIEAKEFDETPGEWCHNCDFLQFCGPGQQEVSN